MTLEEFHILQQAKATTIIEAHIEEDVPTFALSFKDNEIPTHILATQIQNLQKSRQKLPNYFRSRCIIPTRAFEQASSELTSSFKSFSGKNCLDLTCGLGVDSKTFSTNFKTVHAVEIDAVLQRVTNHNLAKLGINNVKMHHSTALAFLQSWEGESFDLIYIDPDRRDEYGRRQVILENCSPNVFELMPYLEKLGEKILIKVSPLFDLTEATRLFPNLLKIWVISVKNECKEVWLEFNPKITTTKPVLSLILYRQEQRQIFNFSWPLTNPRLSNNIPNGDEKYLYEGDVAFYKSNSFTHLLSNYYPEIPGDFNQKNAYFFSNSLIDKSFPGRRFVIIESMPYKAINLKKRLKALGIKKINISRRAFLLNVTQIRKQIGIAEGGERFLFCSKLGSKNWVWIGERVG